MNILLVLIPVTALIVLIGVVLFFWAVNHQQFEDMESPASLPLLDEGRAQATPDNAPDDFSDPATSRPADAPTPHNDERADG